MKIPKIFFGTNQKPNKLILKLFYFRTPNNNILFEAHGWDERSSDDMLSLCSRF